MRAVAALGLRAQAKRRLRVSLACVSLVCPWCVLGVSLVSGGTPPCMRRLVV